MFLNAAAMDEIKTDVPFIQDLYHDDRFAFAGIPYTGRPHSEWVLFKCKKCKTRYFEKMQKVRQGLGNALHKLERYPLDPYSTISEPEAMLAISRCRKGDCS